MAYFNEGDLQSIPTDKALVIGSYGEAIAGYRYLTLAEKALTEENRHVFAEMADEEQEHKQRLHGLLGRLFPDASFVLTDSDKELVVVGPRLMDVHDIQTFAEAMRMILFSERKTAEFYGKLCKYISEDPLRDLFRELAEEGIEHYKRLRKLAERAGVAAEE